MGKETPHETRFSLTILELQIRSIGCFADVTLAVDWKNNKSRCAMGAKRSAGQGCKESGTANANEIDGGAMNR